MATWGVDLPFRECLEQLEWEIQRLESRATEWESANPRTRARQDRSSRADRAFSFIFVAGALENLFREVNERLASDLQAVEVRSRDLRPTALSLLFPKAWDATNSDRVIRIVKRRELVDTVSSFYADSHPLDLSGLSALGLVDGRTVNVHHFEALWHGLCLSPKDEAVWLTDSHRQAIVSLADKRNTIAHFNTDPRDEAFRYTYFDLRDLARRVLETVERLHEHTLLWLDQYSLASPSGL